MKAANEIKTQIINNQEGEKKKLKEGIDWTWD